MLIILGVYKITNTINNKIYIGESNDIERRWEEHKDNLNNNSHHSYKLQKDWNTYGEDNFSFEVIEEIQKLDNPYKTTMRMIYLEGTYITQYDSINKGYNIENTIEKILNGEKTIVRQPLDKKYLTYLIEHNGMPKQKKEKKKKEIKTEKGKSCIAIYKELKSKGYKFTKPIYEFLESVKLLYNKHDSYYVYNEYIEQEYFINGKEYINKNGYKRYAILITEKGKELIIDLLQKENEKYIPPPDPIISTIHNGSLLMTMLQYINYITEEKYILTCNYNDIFKLLRTNNIFYYDSNKRNIPHNEYIDNKYFLIELMKNEDNTKQYYRIYILDKGKEFLKNLLLTNKMLKKQK